MKRSLLALAAVALPVVGTLGGIAVREQALRGATEWRIPITGYDPLDPLRGHYMAFRYLWIARGDPALCDRSGGCRVCLEDSGRRVLITVPTALCPAPVDLAAGALTLVRGTGAEQGQVSAAARLWVSEARAPLLARQLRIRRIVAVARLTRDGRLIATQLEPAE